MPSHFLSATTSNLHMTHIDLPAAPPAPAGAPACNSLVDGIMQRPQARAHKLAMTIDSAYFKRQFVNRC